MPLTFTGSANREGAMEMGAGTRGIRVRTPGERAGINRRTVVDLQQDRMIFFRRSAQGICLIE